MRALFRRGAARGRGARGGAECVDRGRAGRGRDEQKLFHAKILAMDLRLGPEAGPNRAPAAAGARGGGAAGGAAAAAAAAAQSSFASHEEYVAAMAPLVLEELRAELLAARGEAAEGAGGGWVEARVAEVPAAETDFQYPPPPPPPLPPVQSGHVSSIPPY